MANPKSINDLQGDRDFAALSPEAQAIVVENVKPGFNQLSPEAQSTVLKQLTGGVTASKGEQKLPIPAADSLLGSVNKGLTAANLAIGAVANPFVDSFTFGLTDNTNQARQIAKQQFPNIEDDPGLLGQAFRFNQNPAANLVGDLIGLAQPLRATEALASKGFQQLGKVPQLQQGFQALPQLSQNVLSTAGRIGGGFGAVEGIREAADSIREGQSATEILQDIARASGEGALIGGAFGGATPLVSKAAPRASQKIRQLFVKQQQPEPLQVLRGRVQQDVVPTVKQRQFIQTASEAPIAQPELKQGLKGKGQFNPISNQSTLKQAQGIIDASEDQAFAIINGAEEPTALTYTVGQDLVRRLQNQGRFEQAIEVVEKIAEKATTQGQAIQSLSIFGRLTPEGALRFGQKVARKHGKKLTEKQAKKLKDLADKVSQSKNKKIRRDNEAALMQELANLEPVSAGERLAGLQTMAQLLNPKTAIRNIGGNSIFGVAEQISDVVAAPLDSIISLFTGKRSKTLPQLKAAFGVQLAPKRTIEIAGRKLPLPIRFTGGFWKGLSQGTKDAIRGVDSQAGVTKTKFDLPARKLFNDPVFGTLEKLLNIELRATDRAFFEATYRESLANQIKASGKRRINDEMRSQAFQESLYRTFQDDNVASQIATGIKRTLNKANIDGFGLGELVLKYPKTPANLLMRAIDYSPIGSVDALMKAVKGQANQRQIVQKLSRSVVGTLTLGLPGYYLARFGIISGRRETDKDISATQALLGKGQYRVNVTALQRFYESGLEEDAAEQEGDEFVSFDWAQPLSVGLAAGANVWQKEKRIQEKNGEAEYNDAVDFLGQVGFAVMAGADTLTEQGMLRGIQDLFGTRGEEGVQSPTEGLLRVFLGTLSSFTPAVVRQANQLSDNVIKETRDPNDLTQAVNRFKANVPGLAQTLPDQVDITGQPRQRFQDGSNSVFNVLFNPAFVGKRKSDPVLNETLRIFESTGEKQQALRIAPRKVTIKGLDGKKQKIELTGEQLSQYQASLGKRSHAILEAVIKLPQYQQLDDETRASVISSILTNVNKVVKKEVLGDRSSLSMDQRIIQKGNVRKIASLYKLRIIQRRFRGRLDALKSRAFSR